jgi:hypothetical protein
MDQTSSNIVAFVSIALSVGTAIIGVINHKRIRSNCCGKNGELSFDIENTTPPSHPGGGVVSSAVQTQPKV